MTFKNKVLIALIILGYTHIAFTQNNSYHGAPHIRNYDPINYEGGKYVWTICQDSRGVMFFGDGGGVIEYDGSNWRRHAIPNESVVRSLAADSSGTIYVGANNDFGYLWPDSVGSFKYQSLNHLLPNKSPSYQSIWRIFVTKEGVYYISQKSILRYTNNSVEIIPVDLIAPCASIVDGNIYLMDETKGFSILVENQLISLPNCEKLNSIKKGFSFVNSYSDDEIVLSFSRHSGFYIYNLTTHTIKSVDFSQSTKDFFSENYEFFALKLDDSRTAVSTSQGGIAILNKDKEIISVINEERGLLSNSVYSLFYDSSKNLWAATRKGISRIDISYPATFYGKKQGIEGDVISSKLHNGIQYLGTDSKCYFLPPYEISPSHDNHIAERIAGIHDCWQFTDIEGHLLVSNWYGLSEIRDNKTKDIYHKNIRVFCTAYDKRYPNKIMLGQNHALVICTVDNIGKDSDIELKETFVIKDSISQIRSMVFDDAGNLWLASYNEGISMVSFNNDDLTDYKITHFSEKNGLPKEIQESLVEKFDGKINIFTPKGIYKVVLPSIKKTDSVIRFAHDSNWGKMFTDDSCKVKYVKQINANRFFIHGDKTGILDLNHDSVVFDYKPFLKLKDISSVTVEENRYLNIGGSDYFCRYDTDTKKDASQQFRVLMRKVLITSNDSILFNGAYVNSKTNKVTPYQTKQYVPTIENKYNSLRFNFSSNYLESSEKNKYKYMLEGFDKSWKSWSLEPSAIYTNIPQGTYNFKVMSKNVYGTLSPICSYSFIVKPAWYETKIAYLFYCILSILLIAFFAKIFNRTLTKQNNKLERLVKIRTQELQDTINKLKETQSNLVQQEKMASLGILTAGVAHEINNPLNYILGGYTGLELHFEHVNEQNEEVQMLMDSIRTGVDRAAEIVSGLNQFSRTQNTFDETCDLHSILDNSILMIKHLLKSKIDLNKSFKADLFLVEGNVGKLHQVFINILTNACQAIHGTGEITVITKILNNSLLIEISDTGEGIETKNLDKITDPFFTTKEPGKGSGLGLSITYKIIQEHKGSLTFNSELGKSTTAIISLPLSPKNSLKNTSFKHN